jgi:Ca2+-dependent lipid-binding protein
MNFHPYVQIWSPFAPNDSEKKMMRTRVVNDNNNPIFYNTIESYYYAVDYEWSPPVVLDIYDQDSGTFSSDDYIGRAVIFLDQAGE